MDLKFIKLKLNQANIILYVISSLLLKIRFNYRMLAIISRGLYFFTPLFNAVYILERLVLQIIIRKFFN